MPHLPDGTAFYRLAVSGCAEATEVNEALFFLVALLFIWMGVTVRENMRLERRVQSLEAEVQATKDQVKSVTQAIMQLSTQITEQKQ
jgi:phage-related minor tail protein